MENKKKILLIDLDDTRRATRVGLLTSSGYDVDLRDDYIAAERLDHEGFFDLVIVALHGHPERPLPTAITSAEPNHASPSCS
jgi:hypothetical protein